MKNTKQTKSKLKRYTVAALAASLIVNVSSINKVHDLKDALNEAERSGEELTSTLNELRGRLSLYEEDFEVLSDTPPQYLDVPLNEDIQNYIWSLCCNYNIAEHYELIFAVIKTESNFSATATSHTQDYGLMQINVVNHEHLQKLLGVHDFFDPYQNIHCGIYLLSTLLHRYDVADALMAYNMGEGNASKLWERGIHTTPYSESVLENYKQYI